MTELNLIPFDEARRAGQKLTWDERVQLIEDQFPSVLTLNWKKAFDRDMDLFAWMIQDILKNDAASPGRSGPKPSVEYRSGVKRFRQMMGDDFSMNPFVEAFRILAQERSLSHLSTKTGLSRSRVDRLLRGVMSPSGTDMEAIAKGFGKHPGYFAEYRRAAVVAAIAHRLTEVPEASVKYFIHIKDAA